jgi:hypothetical protein
MTRPIGRKATHQEQLGIGTGQRVSPTMNTTLKRSTAMKSRKEDANQPKLVLPYPPDDWWTFRRSGRIREPEIATVKAVQRGNPEMESYDMEFLVEAYRSYKRKNLDKICMERAARMNIKVVHEKTVTIGPTVGKNDRIKASDSK